MRTRQTRGLNASHIQQLQPPDYNKPPYLLSRLMFITLMRHAELYTLWNISRTYVRACVCVFDYRNHKRTYIVYMAGGRGGRCVCVCFIFIHTIMSDNTRCVLLVWFVSAARPPATAYTWVSKYKVNNLASCLLMACIFVVPRRCRLLLWLPCDCIVYLMLFAETSDAHKFT